jgi:septal ring factor EnvC (AmiA/AmiB activator)
VRGRTATLSACLLAVVGALAAPLASGAGSPSELRGRADALRQQNAALAARSRGAVLGLYSLDSRLSRVRAQLDVLRARAARLERARAEVAAQVRVARRVLTVSERQLAQRLRALYEQGDVDPLAVILGATSLNDAIATLDDLSRTAQQNRDVIEQTRAARHRLEALSRQLAARQAEVGQAAAAAAATAEYGSTCELPTALMALVEQFCS